MKNSFPLFSYFFLWLILFRFCTSLIILYILIILHILPYNPFSHLFILFPRISFSDLTILCLKKLSWWFQTDKIFELFSISLLIDFFFKWKQHFLSVCYKLFELLLTTLSQFLLNHFSFISVSLMLRSSLNVCWFFPIMFLSESHNADFSINCYIISWQSGRQWMFYFGGEPKY